MARRKFRTDAIFISLSIFSSCFVETQTRGTDCSLLNGKTEAQAGDTIVQGGIVGLETNSLADTRCLVETYQVEILGFEPLSLRARGKDLESTVHPSSLLSPFPLEDSPTLCTDPALDRGNNLSEQGDSDQRL